MSNQYSMTPNRQPVPDREAAEQTLERIGELNGKVLRGSEQSLLIAGLIFILVNVCTRIYAMAMNQAGLQTFSEIEIRLVHAHAEPGGIETAVSAGRRKACCRSMIAQGM